jgi:hypothetical protein
MDFDHRDPSSKVMRVTAMVGRAGIQRILAEAAKCDIVCAELSSTSYLLTKV